MDRTRLTRRRWFGLQLCGLLLGSLLASGTDWTVQASQPASSSAPSIPLPQDGGAMHLGVASCANSVCHGAVSPRPDSNVLQNEYHTWSLHDRHARAYRTLLSEESQRIAKKLGLPNAHEAKICLDCHTDHVPPGQRGRRFQISDGVGCEACHGGAEQWIKSHTEAGVSHADNIKAGLYPTEQPIHRARLCLSCHQGTTEKLASHDIMGAGHPRLSFELDTFTVLQPEHYRKDADYEHRKPGIDSVQVWASGQLISAERSLQLLASPRFHGGGMFPEISFYDCHACHHPLNDLRWQPGVGPVPGAVRLNDAPLQMASLLLAQWLPEQRSTWQQGVQALQRASQTSPQAVKTAAQALTAQLPAIAIPLQQPISAIQLQSLLRLLLTEAQQGRFHDYTSAEQLVMACSVLFTSLGIDTRLKTTLDNLYQALADEHRFNPQQLRKAADKALKEVNTYYGR